MRHAAEAKEPVVRLPKAITLGEQSPTERSGDAIDATMHLTTAILLHTAAAWGPRDKATKLPRLWLPTAAPVIAGETTWPLDAAQRRKLGKVLRLRRGDELRVFDRGMGEWLASYEDDCVVARERTREPTPATPLELFFAPIKKKRTSLLIEKAVELGATSLRPVGTRVRMSRRRDGVPIAAMACWWGPHRLHAIDATAQLTGRSSHAGPGSPLHINTGERVEI